MQIRANFRRNSYGIMLHLLPLSCLFMLLAVRQFDASTVLHGGCHCNSHAKHCHPLTGKCYCSTKGIVGDHCERCDVSQGYVGDPRNGTCYYEVPGNSVYTFSPNSDDDANITSVNFQNRPVKEGADVTFKLECSDYAKVNMTVVSGPDEPARQMLRASICSKLQKRFDAEEYKLGGNNKTALHVYVYDFQAPIDIKISFDSAED